MTHPIGRDSRLSTTQTRVLLEEHDWLYRVFKSADNTSPTFRLPDLLSACVTLALESEDGERRLADYLATQLTLRDPKTEQRSCDIWRPQFEQVLAAHRAAWNRFPHPMFQMEHIATACVALAMERPDGRSAVLHQARLNLLARAKAGAVSAD